MFEADIDVFESWAYCVQLAVLLTTYCSFYHWFFL